MKKTVDIKKLTVVAMMCALSFLCVFVFRIKVSFLTFDAKDAIIAIVSLLYGPLWGLVSAIVVPLLEFLSVSDTGVYGLIMNFLSSATFAVVCGSVYKYKRNFTGAILGVLLAALSMTAVMMVANLFITPFYMGVSRTQVAALIPTLLLPFNFTKSILNAALTLCIYKPFTTALRQARLLPKVENNYQMSKKTILLLTVSLLVAAGAVITLLLLLPGEFELFRTLG